MKIPRFSLSPKKSKLDVANITPPMSTPLVSVGDIPTKKDPTPKIHPLEVVPDAIQTTPNEPLSSGPSHAALSSSSSNALTQSRYTGRDLLKALWQSKDKYHQIGSRDRHTKQFNNRPADGISEALSFAESLSDAGVDAYFACAEFDTRNNRKASNVFGACGYWMDVDCGADKVTAGNGYPTEADALVATSEFCNDAKLPMPTHIVSSGGGLHLYWVLDGVVDRKNWQVYAGKLKILTKALAFLADDSRTTDIASVLRPPDTFNYKYEPRRRVTLLQATDTYIQKITMLGAIDSAFTKHCNPASQLQVPSGNTRNKSNNDVVQCDYGPPDLARLAAALATLDPDCDESTWKLQRVGPLVREARKYPQLSEKIYQLTKTWSSGELVGKPSKAWGTPGKSNGLTGEQVFESVWQRFSNETNTGNQTSLGTIFRDATDAGWLDATKARVTEIGQSLKERHAEQFTKVEGTKVVNDMRGEQCAPTTSPVLSPLKAIQKQFALINMEGKLWVIEHQLLAERSEQGLARKVSFSNKSDGTMLIRRALRAKFPNSNLEGIVSQFYEEPGTTCYSGLEFNPVVTTNNRLNMWVGPTISPKAGDWTQIQSFLLVVICDGNQDAYQFLIHFIAHALQRPEEKPGILIILLGGQGTGKGTLGRMLHAIWSATFLQVYNIDVVTGNFNASLERTFFVFMDEALFVGDRRASDALKSLVTEPLIQINEKYQPARQTRSYHRFVAATNADHFKNTERDDRRDFVLRVSESRKGDHQYWRVLHQAIDNGGVAAMVHDLLAWDLSEFNVRNKPETPELLEQKLQSLGPIARWWYDALDGAGVTAGCEWSDFIATSSAIKCIVELAGGKLFHHPAAIDVVCELLKMCPSASKKQQQQGINGRQRGLSLPSLQQARSEFEQYIGGAVTWSPDYSLKGEVTVPDLANGEVLF